MDIKMEGNPGTGNSFHEYHINNVGTFAPNAVTVINNNYGDHKPFRSSAETGISESDLLQRKTEIMDYVGNLKQYVAPGWKNRYESTWDSILGLPPVAAAVYEPGKQKDTTFNRNLVANIIYILCNCGVITETNATTLTLALEGDKDHSVRGELRKWPADTAICDRVKALLAPKR